MIKVKHYNNVLPSISSLDPNRNMLIIGDGGNNNNLSQILYCVSKNYVESLFPDSELLEAYSIAETIGVNHVFVINARDYSEYLEVVEVARHYDFAYIVPIGIKFSDEFYNSEYERMMTFSEFYLDQIGSFTNSTIVMTDSHASLYEDIDSFLVDMRSKISEFKTVAQKALQNGRNLCLIANNLLDYKYANVVLTSMICAASNADYPEYDVGKAVFDIDSSDIENLEMAYFNNNFLINTSVENLKTFRVENDAAKLLMIDSIIKQVERKLDFSDFRGRPYTEYLRIKIQELLSKELTEFIGVLLTSFEINEVSAYKTGASECNILNDFSISPINSIDELNIVMEV